VVYTRIWREKYVDQWNVGGAPTTRRRWRRADPKNRRWRRKQFNAAARSAQGSIAVLSSMRQKEFEKMTALKR